MSVYTPGIPAAGTSIPAQDRSLISQNFTQLNTQFAIDHIAFDAGSLNGYHTKIHLTQQGSDPGAVALTPILYTKLSNSIDELFMRRALGDGSAIIQMTYGNATYVAGPVTSGGLIGTANGQTFLPGGFQMKFGRIQITGTGATVSYSANAGLDAFPTATLQVQIMPVLNAATNANITALTKNDFTFNSNGTAGSLLFYWTAIGN